MMRSLSLGTIALLLGSSSRALGQTVCAGPDEISDGIVKRYVALATSSYPPHVANREALGIPAAAASQVTLVTDSTLCAHAGAAYAQAERDSALTSGRVAQPGDSALGRVVYVVRVANRYVVADSANVAGEWFIAWVFDSTLTTPIRRNGT